MGDWLEHFLSMPLVALMAMVILGYLLGKISVQGVSLGASGVLLVGLVFGHFGYVADGTLKNFGLVCFVTAVGFAAGPVFFRIFQQKAFAYIFLSVAVVLAGLLLTFFVINMTTIPADLALGLFTGALTSTPGLAAATEAMGEGAMVGYGIAYPFGVVCVVLFIQLVPRILKIDLEEMAGRKKQQQFAASECTLKIRPWYQANHHSLREFRLPVDAVVKITHDGHEVSEIEDWTLVSGDRLLLKGNEDVLSQEIAVLRGPLWHIDQLGLFSFFLIAVLGVALAQIAFPLPGKAVFSLGNSGGPLILGLIAGHFGHCGRFSLQIPETTQKVLQEVGLLLFLAGAGSEAGQSVMDVLQQYGLWLFIIGAVITIIPMLIGYCLARSLFHFDLLDTLGAICGSMTSTPSLGALIQTSNSNVAAAIYAVTYPVALMMIVLSAQLTAVLF